MKTVETIPFAAVVEALGIVGDILKVEYSGRMLRGSLCSKIYILDHLPVYAPI